MSFLKRLAALLSLVTSLVAIYESYIANTATSILVLGVGLLLFVDSLVCFAGLRQAFYGSAVLSFVVIPLEILSGMPFAAGALLLITLSSATVVLDLVVLSAGSKMPEQGNPMNLPVFG